MLEAIIVFTGPLLQGIKKQVGLLFIIIDGVAPR